MLGVIAVIALAAAGALANSGPISVPLDRAQSVVLVSIPGLRWQDLEAVDAPTLEGLLEATAVLSVRAIGTQTSRDEGYLTIGAGNRLDAPNASFELSGGGGGESGRQVCVSATVLEAAARSAADALAGAEAGALGRALTAAGVRTSVWGSAEAVAALMDDVGCVDAYSPDWPTSLSGGVSLVEVGDLTVTARARERRTALELIETRLASLAFADDATVLLVAPSAIDDQAQVTVAAVRMADSGNVGDRSLVSATTRRADYVTLPDIAPTILDVLGLAIPDSMNGTAIGTVGTGTAGTARSGESQTSDTRVAELADLADRVAFRDRAVGPVSVVLVVLGVACGVAGLMRRARLARMLAPVVVAYPTLTFALGATDYHRLPLDAVVALLLVGSFCVAAFAVSLMSRWGPGAGVTLVGATLWLLLVVDVVTGGRLQINTPLGYTPTIAGRFQGFGNLAFGLVAAAGLVVAVAPMVVRRSLVARPSAAAVWAAWIGAITTVVVAAPAFGSDIGGTLAVVPAFAVTVASLAGLGLGWRRIVLMLGAGAVVVGMAAWIDLQRPEGRRTHAGRFLDDLLTGDGWLVVRRKLSSNIDILTSSIWSILFAGVLGALVVAAWRQRTRLRQAFDGRPVERAYLAGWATVAALGFALNDSGIAVPAIMTVVGGAWVVSMVLPVARRAGR